MFRKLINIFTKTNINSDTLLEKLKDEQNCLYDEITINRSCVCGYAFVATATACEDEQNEYSVKEVHSGDDDFIRLAYSRYGVVQYEFNTSDYEYVYLYMCPKCGTVKGEKRV